MCVCEHCSRFRHRPGAHRYVLHALLIFIYLIPGAHSRAKHIGERALLQVFRSGKSVTNGRTRIIFHPTSSRFAFPYPSVPICVLFARSVHHHALLCSSFSHFIVRSCRFIFLVFSLAVKRSMLALCKTPRGARAQVLEKGSSRCCTPDPAFI